MEMRGNITYQDMNPYGAAPPFEHHLAARAIVERSKIDELGIGIGIGHRQEPVIDNRAISFQLEMR